MSQAFAESHVGVWKRRFATWVRARMDAVGEDNEESKRAKTIKQSWPDVADTITAAVNTACVVLVLLQPVMKPGTGPLCPVSSRHSQEF